MIIAVMTSAVLRLVIKDVLSTLDLIPFILHQKLHYLVCPSIYMDIRVKAYCLPLYVHFRTIFSTKVISNK